MEFLLKVNLSCFLFSYLVALIAEVIQVLRARTPLLQAVSFVAAVAGLIAHSCYLIARFQESGLPPLVGSSHDWMLVLAWLGALLPVLLTVATHASHGLFWYPGVVILVLLAIRVDATPSETLQSQTIRWWAMLHASSLVLGIAMVTAATASALMYLLQYQKLRGGLLWVRRLTLPSLERLTSVNYWLVLSCFPLLTIGLFSGVFLATGREGSGQVQWTDPIVGGTTCVWAIMTVRLVLLFRSSAQTGTIVARRTLLAGGFLLLTILGLTFATGGIHSGPTTSTNTLSSTASQEVSSR